MSDFRGAGGTEGGVGTFLFGFVMAVGGGWLLTNQVTVTSGFWRLWGYNAFGLSLLPLVIGIAGHGDDLKRVGRLAFKSIIYFEIVTTVALRSSDGSMPRPLSLTRMTASSPSRRRVNRTLLPWSE